MDSFSFSLKVSMASPLIMWKMAAELCRKPAKPWPRNLRRSNAQVAAWLHKTCIVSSRFKMFQSWSLFQDTSRRPNCHCSGVDIIFPQRHSQLAAWALPSGLLLGVLSQISQITLYNGIMPRRQQTPHLNCSTS